MERDSNPPIAASVNIQPNVLSLKSEGRWIIAFIKLLENYNENDININTVFLEGVVPVEQSQILYDTSMVWFDKAMVTSYIYNVLGIRIEMSP